LSRHIGFARARIGRFELEVYSAEKKYTSKPYLAFEDWVNAGNSVGSTNGFGTVVFQVEAALPDASTKP
jgi:hypothetical protein